MARSSQLELLRPDKDTGKVHTVLSTNVFGCIRALHAFRLTGGSKGMLLRYARWCCGN